MNSLLSDGESGGGKEMEMPIELDIEDEDEDEDGQLDEVREKEREEGVTVD